MISPEPPIWPAPRAWQAYQDAQTLRGEAEQEWEDLDLDNLEDRIDDARIEVRDL